MEWMLGIVAALCALASGFFGWRWNQLKTLEAARQIEIVQLKTHSQGAAAREQQQQQELAALQDRFRTIVDADAEAAQVRARVETAKAQFVIKFQEERAKAVGALESERNSLQVSLNDLNLKRDEFKTAYRAETAQLAQQRQLLENQIATLRRVWGALDESASLQEFGFYQPHYDFASSEKYQLQLERIRTAQKRMLTAQTAAVCAIEWMVNGSASEGRKQIKQTLKLILRAFNGETDAAIVKVRYNNIHVMETRIRKAWESVNKLASVQQCGIVSEYCDLKIQELHLAHEYQEKVFAEKEEQRRIREQMREEEIAQREIEKVKAETEREEQRYAEALGRALQDAESAVGARQQKLLLQIEQLQAKLQEAQANKQRALSRAQMTRSGHVYVISNLGSFGEGIYKIGMTRRLEPLDRVRELGDASVPFLFDVHTIIYTDDAPALEAALHRQFHHRRVNRVNERKEFFRVSLSEIARAVRQHHGEIEFVPVPQAMEYRKTLAMPEARVQRAN